MREVLLPRAHLHRHNMPRHLRRKRDLARRSKRRVLRHKQRSAAGHAPYRAHQPAPARHLRVRVHLQARGHPRELARLRDHTLIRLEQQLQHRHRRPNNSALHRSISLAIDGIATPWRLKLQARNQPHTWDLRPSFAESSAPTSPPHSAARAHPACDTETQHVQASPPQNLRRSPGGR